MNVATGINLSRRPDASLYLPDRVSNASGFYLRAIASPKNSTQFRTIARNSRTVARY